MNVLTRLPELRPISVPPAAPRPTVQRANIFARPQPGSEPFPYPRFTAWLNHTDRVICLPAHWDEFTRMIGSPGLSREAVLGRPVSRFIEDETVRELFRVVLERARKDARAVRISARCDSAIEARAMQLRLTPMSAGAIECTWSFFQGAVAEEIPNPRRLAFNPAEHVRMCGWCRQIHVHRSWQKLEDALPALGALDHQPLPLITHGICPQCSATMSRDTSGLWAV